MTEKKEIGESINFVSRHFKEGALLPQSGWKKFRMTHHISSLVSRKNRDELKIK